MNQQFGIDLSSDRYKLDLFIDRSNRDYFSPQEITDSIYLAENLFLNLAFEGYSNKGKQHATAQWMALLPKLLNVKRVSLHHPRSQVFFETVCGMEQLQELYLYGLKIHDFIPISRLKHLNRLYITSCHQLKSIAPVLALNQLEYLSIENCYSIEDLEKIGAMSQLKGLCLTGDSTAPKRLQLPSLKPFQNLKKLKHLDLRTTSVADKSYEVLLELPKLERFDTTSSIKASVVEDIKSRHKSLKAGFFVDWDYANNRIYEGKSW